MKKNILIVAVLFLCVFLFFKAPQTKPLVQKNNTAFKPLAYNGAQAPKRKSAAAPGRQSYTIMQTHHSPNFTGAVIDPEDVKPGQKQIMTVSINDIKASITEVVAEIQTDNGTITNPMHLKSGTDRDGVWEGSWVVKDTHDATYVTIFKAKNKIGELGEARIAWTDPGLSDDSTLGHSTAITVASGTYTVSGVDGADGGRLTISGGSITVAAGAVLVANDLLVSGGTLTHNNDSGIISVVAGNVICMTDADGDHYPATTTQYADGTSCLSGRLRRNTMTKILTIDCGDSGTNAASANPGQVTAQGLAGGFTNTSTGLSFDWNCDGTAVQTWTTLYVCNTSGCAAHYYTIANGWASNPGCSGAGTWETTAGISAGTCTTLDSSATCANTTTAGRTQTCL